MQTLTLLGVYGFLDLELGGEVTDRVNDAMAAGRGHTLQGHIHNFLAHGIYAWLRGI